MIDKDTIQNAKDIDIHKILEFYDWETDETGYFTLCPNPIHDDKHPSCGINNDNNTIRCFSCSSTFDTISLYQNLSKKVNDISVSFPRAVEAVLNLDGKMIFNEVQINNRVEAIPQKNSFLTTDYIIANCKPIQGYELNYLHQRGIFIYDAYVYDGLVTTAMNLNKLLQNCTDKAEEARLQDIKQKGKFYRGISNILKDNRISIKHNYYNGINSIVYSIRYDIDEDEELATNAYFIKDKRDMIIKKSLDKNHIKQAIGESNWNWIAEGEELAHSRKIYICEGLEDALSFVQNGERTISLNSISNLRSLIEYLQNEHRPKQKQLFSIAFDNDEAGRKATKELTKFFELYNGDHDRKYNYEVYNLPMEFHDVNDYWKHIVYKKSFRKGFILD